MKKWNPPQFGEKKDTEQTCYTVAIGNLPMIPNKEMAKALDLIQQLEGFIGIYPCYPHGALCLFVSRNDAIRGMNDMKHYGIKTGKNIEEVYV